MGRDPSIHGQSHLPWAKKFLFWCIMLAIPLLVLEAGTRAFFAHQLGSSLLFYGTRLNRERGGDAHSGDMNLLDGYFKYHPHERRFTRDKETGRLISVGINGHGFRGAEFNPAKDPRVTRVVTLGASSTFGFSDGDNETYPYYLEQFLNRDSPGRRFEVINLGIPHLTSDQIVALFEQEALPLHPDIVTFYEGINDSWGGAVVFKKQTAGPTKVRENLRCNPYLHRGFRWLRDHLITIGVADAYLKRVRDVPFTEGDIAKHMVGKRESFVANVSAIYDECRRRGIVFIPATQQAKSFLVDREDIRGITYQRERELVRQDLAVHGHVTHQEMDFLTQAAMMDTLTEWVRVHRLPLADVITALDPRRDCLVSWVHLNAEGNRIAARAFERAILAQFDRSSLKKVAKHREPLPR